MKASAYTYIILGLGNPGSEHENTRHNAGRAAAKAFAKTHGFPVFEEQKKMAALVSENTADKTTILLVLPETFMNHSGKTASALKIPFKRVPEKLIVMHDDLDLPLGTVKIIKNRGSAGHKGVESIMRALKTKDFSRIRIGIAKPKDIVKSQTKETVHKIIIGKLPPAEKLLLQKGIKKAADALTAIAEQGVEQAMNKFN